MFGNPALKRCALTAGLVFLCGSPLGARAQPATGPTGEIRNYEMWEDDASGIGGPVEPEEEAADEIPVGDVTRTAKPKSDVPAKTEEPFLAPPPEFDVDAVKDQRFVDQDAPPPNWEDVTPSDASQLKEKGKDPLAAEPPPLVCGNEITLECFVAELNNKITAFDPKKLGHTGCNRVEARLLSGGLTPAYRMDFTGDSGCNAELLSDFPIPPSDSLRAKQIDQLERIRVAVESFCSTWRKFAFENYIRLPAEGDVRLVETSNNYYRIYWEDLPPSPIGPMPTKYSEFMEWRKKKKEWESHRPMGKEIYILLKSDRSEIKRIEREPPTRKLPDPPLTATESYRFSLTKGYNLLSRYRYLRPDHRATGHITYVRSGEFYLPSSARIDYFPSKSPGYFVEAKFSGCGYRRPTPKQPPPATIPAPSAIQPDSLATPAATR